MAVTPDPGKLVDRVADLKTRFVAQFVKKSTVSRKSEINFKVLRTMGISLVFIFIAVVMLMPDSRPVEFSEKIDPDATIESPMGRGPSERPSGSEAAEFLWRTPTSAPSGASGGHGSQVNHDTSMLLGSKANAKIQIQAGARLALRIIDKFIVSTEPVPILAELLMDSTTESGLRLPAGSRFYGEASFQKGSERATVQFKQLSLPDGRIRPLTGIGVGKDGQPGIPGRISSDGLKNTAGSVLTTFVGGLAAGSVKTDLMGRSQGGLENGLLTAVSAAAKERAQSYGEKMKAEREWIEVAAGTECDALLSESMNLQDGILE